VQNLKKKKTSRGNSNHLSKVANTGIDNYGRDLPGKKEEGSLKGESSNEGNGERGGKEKHGLAFYASKTGLFGGMGGVWAFPRRL